MKILIISGNDNDKAEVIKLLHGFAKEVEQISPNEKGEIIQLLSENKYDAVLVELIQEETQPQEPIHLKILKRFPHIPFILICESEHTDRAISSITDGVQDYYVRNEVSSPELTKIIRNSIKRENLRNKLENAQLQALEAVAYKDRMLERLSQQMRTPLNAVTGMAELMQDTDLNSKQGFYTQIIRESANSLVSLINDLLDFSKIEAGLVKLKKHPFQLYDSISECIHTVLPAAIQQKLELIYHVSPDCPKTLLGDDLRIRQIILNLLENAIKFTERGYVRLTVSYCNSGQQTLCFEVEDSGKGIESEAIPTLFKPYTKLDEDKVVAGPGVGLGLAICQNLVQMMNGIIKVDSEPGKGSRFKVSLPLEGSDIELADQYIENRLLPPQNSKVLFLTSNHLHDELLIDYAKHWKLQLHIQQSDEDTPVFGKRLDDYDLLISNIRESLKLDLKLIDRVRAHKKMPHILIKNPEKANDRLTVIRKDTVILLKPLDMVELGEAIALVFKNQADQLNTTHKVPIPDEHLGEYHPLDILVADDNAINQRIVQGVLNRYSYQPKLVENGQLAVEASRQRVYDVILMDIRMPVLNGVEATIRIRKELPPDKQPLIVALTANALLKSRQQYLDSGMDEVLYKPVQTKSLVELLARAKRLPR